MKTIIGKEALAIPTLYIVSALTAVAEVPADLQKAFPYPLVETTGQDALDEWIRLRAEPGTPIIVGPLEDLEALADLLDPDSGYDLPDPESILADAAALTHPDALLAVREAEWRRLKDWAAEKGYTDMAEALGDSFPAPLPPGLVGTWPGAQIPHFGLYSVTDFTGAYFDTVYIAVLPTENAYEAPAYLKFGGWNANPAPEVHVAAFRDWEVRYGAVPVVMTTSVVEFALNSPPRTKEEAMTLAHEHYMYCADIVDQGVVTVSALGATLIGAPFWYFWWD